MTDIRQNILTGDWVVIASRRALRPESFSTESHNRTDERLSSCPFCAGNENQTPPEVFALRPDKSLKDTKGWKVRVVPNKFPAFLNEKELNEPEESGIYTSLPAYGYHEVIIHGPNHSETVADMDTQDLGLVLNVYQQRLSDLSLDQKTVSAIIIINQGREAGASIEHPHSQLFTMPMIAPRQQRELERIKRFKTEQDDCPLCAMLKYEQAFKERVVAENDYFLAFCPFASGAPFEVIIAPKKHQRDFREADKEEIDALAQIFKFTFGRLGERLKNPPYNTFLHTRPFQTDDDYHWHFVIMPKTSTMAGFEFGTGMMINIVGPEAAAKFLREP